MGIFDWLWNKKKPVIMFVDVGDSKGEDLGTGVSGEASWGTAPVQGTPDSYRRLRFELPNGTRKANLVIKADGYYESHSTITVAPVVMVRLQRKVVAPPIIPVPPVEPSFPQPQGVVKTVSRAIVDDRGPFYPLYGSLFWAQRGLQQGAMARVRRNAKWYAGHGFDGVRWFHEVFWEGGGPEGPLAIKGTVSTARDTIDLLFEYGLRSVITVQAGVKDPLRCVDEVLAAVQGREHKILMLEGTNERWANSYDDAVEIARRLKASGLPVSVGFGDLGADDGAGWSNGCEGLNILTDRAGVDCVSRHPERSNERARNERQCWDGRYLKAAAWWNEPQGPESSVASTRDANLLAAMRGGAIICGAEAYCFHTGAGIYGYDYQSKYGFRHANVYDAGLDEMAVALRGVDKVLGHTGVGNWKHDHMGFLGLEAKGAFEKDYGARVGNEFLHVVTDVHGPVRFEGAALKYHKLFDPATGREIDPNNPGGVTCYFGRGEFA